MDEEMAWVSTWQCFFVGEVSGGQVSWATSNPHTINLASQKLQLEFFCFFLIEKKVFSSSLPYQPLPQITLSWA